MTHHDRTHPMDLLERKFANDAEAHMLLAMIDSAFCVDRHELWSLAFCDRVRRCVEEHIRLSGDQYDRR
jgi:hypothetical protein